MELNKIKLLDKAELLQRLKQSGFTEVVKILEDKEIHGEKFTELREFEIFKWKLTQPQKKCLWDCIKEIKAKPHILLMDEKPKLQSRSSLQKSSRFSQKKGKLENLLNASAASIGIPSTSSNIHTINSNNVNKNAENNFPRKSQPPPAPLRKKPPLPLPDKTNNKCGGSEETRNLKTDSSPKFDLPDTTEMYMDMQAPKNIKKVVEEEDGDYLTPNEVSVPDATGSKNSSKMHAKNTSFNSFGKRHNAKNTSNSPPPPPPLPNFLRNNSGHRNLPPPPLPNIPRNNSGQRNLPNIENQEEDTYELPPRIGNVHRILNFPRSGSKGKQNYDASNLNKSSNSPAGANTNVITTNKFSVEVVTDETDEDYEIVDRGQKRPHKQFLKDDEFDEIYENPPSVNSRITPNKFTRRTEINKTNNPINTSESAVEAEPANARKTTIKDLENIIITNEKETQGAVLTTLKTLGSFFRVKRPKDAYENHSIIPSETRESVNTPIRSRPLPDTPIETARQREDPTPTHNLFSKPFPPPRQMMSVPPGEYVKLVPTESLLPSTIIPQNEFEQKSTKKEHISPFTTRRGSKTTYIKKDNTSNTSVESNNETDEEIIDYENSNNYNAQPPQVTHSEDIISKLTKELIKRNLLNKEESRPTSSEFDSDFEEDDDDQPVYDNTPTQNSNISANQANINLPRNSITSKNVLPTFNISTVDKDDEDLEQPIYDNTPPPARNIFGQRQIISSPNLCQLKNILVTRDSSKVDKKDDDQDQPLYDNSPILNRKTTVQKKSLSPNPHSFKINPTTRNVSRIDQYSHDNNDFDDNSSSYGNIKETVNPLIPNVNTLNRRKNNLHPNPLPFASKILPSTSINSTINNEDAHSLNYNTKKEETSIFNRPLPDIPKNAIPASNLFKYSPNLDRRSPIKNENIRTPNSSEEDNADENATYGNIDEAAPTFKNLPPKTATKPKKVDRTINSLPKPPTPLNYEHYMVNEGKSKQVTVRQEQKEGIFHDSIFNVNDDPYYRNTDRKGAKLLLKNLEDGAFLFRPSHTNSTHFLVLTLKYKGKYYNLGIERSSGNKIRLNAEGDSTAPEFSTLTSFVKYFEGEPVTFEDNKGAIVEIYLKPVLPSTLY